MSDLKVLARVKENTEQGMFGYWVLPSGKSLMFGTLQWRSNESDISSIPYGLINFHRVRSHKRSEAAGVDVFVYEAFDATPGDGIDDTSGRVAVQIHKGNYAGNVDKGYKSDVQGCFILGMSLGNDGKTGQRMVVRSGDAMEIFDKEMGGKDFTLDFGAA
jgi:hypothetical protein